MILKINRLEITNFKGIQHAVYEFGIKTSIFGRNASGKSSIVDAYCWLLFNKDARGNTPGSDKFHEKPLDSDGNEIHNLETTVYAECTLDGQPFNLRRTQRENWVKKRGYAEATYQGNTSVYWINEVETPARDFQTRINNIANGDVFSMLTSLGAFCAMDWKKRRALLLKLSGIDVDAELLRKPEYAGIAEEMAKTGVTVDNLKKVIQDRKKSVHKELLLIPARVDEARRMRPVYTAQQISDAEYSLNDASKDIENCDRLIAELRSENGTDKAQRRIIELEAEATSIRRGILDEADAARRRAEGELRTVRSLEFTQAQLVRSYSDSLTAAQDKVKLCENALTNLRQKYKTIHDEAFVEPETPEVCPYCNQQVPEDMRWSIVTQAREAFMADKKKKLQSINQDGVAAKQEAENARFAANEAQKMLEQANADHLKLKADLEKAKQAVASLTASPDYNTPRLSEIMEELTRLRTEQHTSPDARLKAAEQRRRDLADRVDRAREMIAQVKRAEEVDKRIADLETQQTEYGQKQAELEAMIFTIEKFVTERCGLLEESINSAFPTIRWKLFDTQINGAIIDCCECMIPCDGVLVPYNCANTAASVSADIEIIDVLSQYYDIVAPVFVDNAERVNYVVRQSGQLITLSVSSDSELNIIIDKNKEAA